MKSNIQFTNKLQGYIIAILRSCDDTHTRYMFKADIALCYNLSDTLAEFIEYCDYFASHSEWRERDILHKISSKFQREGARLLV